MKLVLRNVRSWGDVSDAMRLCRKVWALCEKVYTKDLGQQYGLYPYPIVVV